MKHDKTRIIFGAILLSLSIVFYIAHYLIFRDPHHLFIFMLGDMAFAFVEVLIVTLIIHEVLNYRDKQSAMNKMNMVIGTFFSEAGSPLLKTCASLDENAGAISASLLSVQDWNKSSFRQKQKEVLNYEYRLQCPPEQLESLKVFLSSKRPFLINLLQNPNLLEHETFTNLLWAIFHLADELEHRTDFQSLSEADQRHLTNDLKRAYGLLITEWLSYVNHLRESYPYLFSLAVRTNPFNPAASAMIKD
ncbi:MAG: hypothetical protein JW884_05905 [Deltaproteobacteria bacterium]|nr:hypothetical protein [Deltaproteobacteria bacterium]